MTVTINDIARAAGVGRTTVFRALQDKDRISPATKARIKKIAKEMKYRPNNIARSLVLGKSTFVGIVATPSIIPVFQAIIEPIEQALREAGYPILFYTSSGRPEDERLSLEQVIQNRVAGIIVHPSSTPAEPEAYQELVESGTKVVVIDRYLEGVKTPQVICDDYRATRIATEHLISLGHRRIVHMAIPRTSFAGRERSKGFHDAMSEAGIPTTSASTVETPMGAQFGFQIMSDLLKRKNRPTAVVVRQDVVAIGAMRAILASGLTIPRDISIIGNGDFWCDDMLTVPLTTVHFPLEKVARIGVDILLQMLSGKHVEAKTEMLNVDLIIRSSCAPPPPR